jgi:hypothetical protein
MYRVSSDGDAPETVPYATNLIISMTFIVY